MQILPNTLSKLVDATGRLITPWIQYFQQFTQAPPKFANIDNTSYVDIPQRIFILEGDSLTALTGVGGPLQLYLNPTSNYFSNGTTYNIAAGGETTAMMLAGFATQAAPHKKVGNQIVYYYINGGTNDIGGFSIPAATIYNNLLSCWQLARANGMIVIAVTVKPFPMSPAQTIILNDLNAAIIAGNANYDYLIRADLLFPLPAGPPYIQGDGVHFTPAGWQRLAANIALTVVPPFTYTAVEPGYVVLTNGTISEIDLIRGDDAISLPITITIIPVSIADKVKVTYDLISIPTMKFIPIYGAVPK